MLKSQKISQVFGFLVIFCLLFSMIAPMSVFASPASEKYAWDEEKTEIISGGVGDLTGDDIANAIKYANEKSGQANKVKEGSAREDSLYVKIKGSSYELMRVEGSGVAISRPVWADAKDKDITNVMQHFIDGLGKQNTSEQGIQEFMQEFQNADNDIAQVMIGVSFNSVKGDLYQAYIIMKPFLDLLNIVLGIGCVILILILFGSTVMDLAYIGLPVWREAQNDKNGKNPFGVSYEALRTVQEVEKGLGGGDGEYRNAYLLYFKRRALTYIILAICIMYLICGGISGVISFVLNLVGGIV